jgi:site-specific recombinase XerD
MRTGKLPSARPGRPASEPCSDGSIAPRHSVIKAFTRSFIYKDLKLTTRDLLEELERFKGGGSSKDMLTDAEITAIRDSFNLPTFEHVRDRVIFEVHMATAFRFATVLGLALLTREEKLSGRVTVTTKGGKVMQGRLDPAALGHVRACMRLRPDTECRALFVTDAGESLTYDGGRMIWRRIKSRSGVNRLTSHLIRHTYASAWRLATPRAVFRRPPSERYKTS